MNKISSRVSGKRFSCVFFGCAIFALSSQADSRAGELNIESNTASSSVQTIDANPRATACGTSHSASDSNAANSADVPQIQSGEHIEIDTALSHPEPSHTLKGGITKNSNANDWLTKMIGTFANMPGTTIRLNGSVDINSLIGNLRRQPQMSSEDFRKMEYGVLGLAASKWVGGTYYTVREVLPDCPASIAGIKPGDILLQANQHVFSKDDDQRVYWQTVAGKAGTAVDIVVSRDEKPITFHLTRMNIEDIKNDNIRRMFEMKLSLLGPPNDGESPISP